MQVIENVMEVEIAVTTIFFQITIKHWVSV